MKNIERVKFIDYIISNMSITRITSLSGFKGVLVGRDLLEIFKQGHVYEVREILGQIIIDDLGEHHKPHHAWDISTIIQDGNHCLTEKEYELRQNR